MTTNRLISKTVNSLKNSTSIHFLHNPFQFTTHLNKHKRTYMLYMFNNSQTDQNNQPQIINYWIFMLKHLHITPNKKKKIFKCILTSIYHSISCNRRHAQNHWKEEIKIIRLVNFEDGGNATAIPCMNPIKSNRICKHAQLLPHKIVCRFQDVCPMLNFFQGLAMHHTAVNTFKLIGRGMRKLTDT